MSALKKLHGNFGMKYLILCELLFSFFVLSRQATLVNGQSPSIIFETFQSARF